MSSKSFHLRLRCSFVPALGFLLCSAAAVSAAHAEKPTYGRHLLQQVAAGHSLVAGLEILPVKPAPPAAASQPLTWGKRTGAHIDLPLEDVTGGSIGTLRVVFPNGNAQTAAQQRREAEHMRNELRAHTLDAGNLLDPYPYDPRYGKSTYGQHLVDAAFARHPDILVLGLHAKPPDGSASAILASSFGRIGKLDDEGDLKTVESGQAQSAVVPAGNRYNIGLPLHDYLGHTLGLMTVAYPYKDGDDKAALMARAVSVRDEVSRSLLDRASLMESYPLDPTLPENSYVQKLVDEEMLAHPRVVGIGLHVTPPGRSENLIVASSFGRVGQLSDETDLDMIRSGKHTMKVLMPGGERYSGELTLRDSARRTIGSLLTIFPYKSGDDTGAMLKEAKQIRQELAAKIQNVDELLRAR